MFCCPVTEVGLWERSRITGQWMSSLWIMGTQRPWTGDRPVWPRPISGRPSPSYSHSLCQVRHLYLLLLSSFWNGFQFSSSWIVFCSMPMDKFWWKYYIALIIRMYWWKYCRNFLRGSQKKTNANSDTLLFEGIHILFISTSTYWCSDDKT